MTHTHRILVATGLVTALILLSPPRLVRAQDEAPDADGSREEGPREDDIEAEEAAAWAELRAEERRALRDEDARLRESELELARASRDADDDDVYARFEVTMGFVGGYASYADLGFSGAPALPANALDGGPTHGTAMAGLRYDVRLVVAFLRMTVGGDFMWGMFDASSERALDDGTMVSDRRIFDGALRFGLGLEANVDGVRLFADVLGTVHFVEAELAQQEVASTYHAMAFAPGLRLGVRIPVVPHFFVQVSADGSPFGPGFIGGDFSVGGAIE